MMQLHRFTAENRAVGNRGEMVEKASTLQGWRDTNVNRVNSQLSIQET
jgi:hypothetical protein